MNPKSFLSKSASVLATLVLAITAAQVFAQPASATDFTTATWSQNPTANSTQLSIAITSCSVNAFASPTPTPQTTDFAVTVNGTSRSVSTVTLGSNISLTLSSAMSGADVVEVAYTKSGTSGNQVPCTTSGNFVGSFTGLTFTVAMPVYTVTLDANNSGMGNNANPVWITQASVGASITLPTTTGAPTKAGCTLRGWAVNTTNATNAILVNNSYTPTSNITLYASWNCSGGGGGVNTCVINGVTQTSITSIVSNTANLVSGGTYHLDWNGEPTLNNCSLPLNANYGILYVLNGSQIGNATYNANVSTITMNSASTSYASLVARPQFSGVTVSDGDVFKIRYFFGGSQSPTISDTPSYEITMNLYPGGVVTGGSQSSSQVTREVTRSIPVPAFQAPILNSLAPKLSSGFSSNGGRLVMKDVKPEDITSVMLNGKKVEVVASKSGAALRIPAGSGAGDLTFTMADGSVINVANAVKITQSQVDPKLVDLNNLPTFKAGSVAVPATIKKALLKNKEIILDSESAKCVGYASSNTASARATALSRASNVCGVITDINENIEPIIKVLVNKTIAKKSPVKYQTW